MASADKCNGNNGDTQDARGYVWAEATSCDCVRVRLLTFVQQGLNLCGARWWDTLVELLLGLRQLAKLMLAERGTEGHARLWALEANVRTQLKEPAGESRRLRDGALSRRTMGG